MEEEKGSRRKLDTVGPMQVIIQEDQNVVWVSRNHKLYRVAPEHLRGLSAFEEFRQNVNPENTTRSTTSSIISSHGGVQFTDMIPPSPAAGQRNDVTSMTASPNVTEAEVIDSAGRPNHGDQTRQTVQSNSTGGSDQPDGEPEVQSIPASQPSDESQSNTREEPNHIEIPVSETSDEDTSETEETGLYVEEELLYNMTSEKAFRFEVDVTQKDIEHWKEEPRPQEMAFLVSAAKRQRSEVKISHLKAL